MCLKPCEWRQEENACACTGNASDDVDDDIIFNQKTENKMLLLVYLTFRSDKRNERTNELKSERRKRRFCETVGA